MQIQFAQFVYALSILHYMFNKHVATRLKRLVDIAKLFRLFHNAFVYKTYCKTQSTVHIPKLPRLYTRRK